MNCLFSKIKKSLFYYLSTLFSDTDECASESTNDCNSVTADCVNQPGEFMCVCKHGFVGDGRNCTGLYLNSFLRQSFGVIVMFEK